MKKRENKGESKMNEETKKAMIKRLKEKKKNDPKAIEKEYYNIVQKLRDIKTSKNQWNINELWEEIKITISVFPELIEKKESFGWVFSDNPNDPAIENLFNT